ncbi:MAG: methionyl-tRNA formyltransferase, partial [Clostridia bacterium]|nr:methionyl-tRNA formyltransferase [Clostridia bacterium]
MRIVFMGTPEFAVPCLEGLVKEGNEVCGVFTRADKPQGRKFVLTAPPVKEAALRLGIPVFQPSTLRDEEARHTIGALRPELIAVVAYGRILPEEVLEIPALGCVNVHASLLPRLRGAAPIQWAVIRGENESGITTMHMAKGLDTGDMILRESTGIGENETGGSLHDRLIPIGARLLCRTVRLIAQGDAPRERQDDALATWAPIIDREVCRINWRAGAREIHNLCRGLNPSPSAFTMLGGSAIKIHSTVLTGEKCGA